MNPKAVENGVACAKVVTENEGKAKKRKPRAKKMNNLSPDEVRKNHVVSEKRRRELVRAIYDDLVNIVPDLRPNENRSEMVIYLKTMNYLKWIYRRNRHLRSQLLQNYSSDSNKKIPEHLIWEFCNESDLREEQKSSPQLQDVHMIDKLPSSN